MQDFTDKERREILGEVLMDEFRVIREYLADVPIIKQKVTKLEEDVAELKIDREWIKRMLAKHDARLDDHDERLDRLEVVR